MRRNIFFVITLLLTLFVLAKQESTDDLIKKQLEKHAEKIQAQLSKIEEQRKPLRQWLSENHHIYYPQIVIGDTLKTALTRTYVVLLYNLQESLNLAKRKARLFKKTYWLSDSLERPIRALLFDKAIHMSKHVPVDTVVKYLKKFRKHKTMKNCEYCEAVKTILDQVFNTTVMNKFKEKLEKAGPNQQLLNELEIIAKNLVKNRRSPFRKVFSFVEIIKRMKELINQNTKNYAEFKSKSTEMKILDAKAKSLVKLG